MTSRLITLVLAALLGAAAPACVDEPEVERTEQPLLAFPFCTALSALRAGAVVTWPGLGGAPGGRLWIDGINKPTDVFVYQAAGSLPELWRPTQADISAKNWSIVP